MSFLGIDLGTSGLRALLVDETGAPIGATERSYSANRPFPGWSEQNPADWIAAVDDALEELRASFPAFVDLRGIGVSGQMHGAVVLDAANEVLRPCILWNDTRSGSQATRLDTMPDVRALSGNIVFPGFTAPKLEWLRENEPDVHARIARVLLPAGYLNHYLTGEFVADMSDSAGTSWLDVGGRRWSDTLLKAGQMRLDQMPSLVEGCEEAGRLRATLLERWGLRGPVVVAGGAGDNAAAACGIGALHEGQGFVSLGTSGVVLVARDDYSPAPETAVHTFCHALPGRWYQMGVMLAATDSLNWLAGVTGQSPAHLTAALGDALKPPSRAMFLPYLAGERTPHNDTKIRGSLSGISLGTSREDLTRAVLEGVAFGLRDNFEALKATGARIDSLMAIGGGTASHYWLRLIATVLNIPLRLPAGGEFGAALGAARLAIVAATGAPSESVMTTPKSRVTIMPEVGMTTLFDDAYASFRATYPALKSLH
ncbi:MAG: xylulokinase [Paracoccaceae bacterium]